MAGKAGCASQIMNGIVRLILLSLLAALHLACNADKPCTLKLEQSPELRGFRLGMLMADIQKRFSGFPSVSANELGVATVEISNDYVRNVLDRHYARVISYPATDEAVVSFIPLDLSQN